MKPKDEQKEEHIYQATLALVEEAGLAGLTMEKVAKKAGLGVGTLYVYFDGKEELLEALYWRIKQSRTEMYFEHLDPAAPLKISFKVVWMRMLRLSVQFYSEDVFTDQCSRSPFISDAMKERTGVLMQPFFQLLERGKLEHLLKDIPTPILVAQIIGFLKELAAYNHSYNLVIDDSTAETTFQLCWDGIKA
jgi:AcrR family transcriptional regulator